MTFSNPHCHPELLTAFIPPSDIAVRVPGSDIQMILKRKMHLHMLCKAWHLYSALNVSLHDLLEGLHNDDTSCAVTHTEEDLSFSTFCPAVETHMKKLLVKSSQVEFYKLKVHI